MPGTTRTLPTDPSKSRLDRALIDLLLLVGGRGQPQEQTIDTLFVRGGDLLSAAAVYVGTAVLHFDVALMIRKPSFSYPHLTFRPLAAAVAVVAMMAVAAPAAAQETREEQQAVQRAEKARQAGPYEPDALERRIEKVEGLLSAKRPVYTFIGSAFEGGGLAVGPAYRARFGDSGTLNAHAAWSLKNYKATDAVLTLPAFANGRISVTTRASWLNAPGVAFYGVGNDSSRDNRTEFAYRATTLGVSARVQAARFLAVGGGLDALTFKTTSADPAYRRSHVFAEIDWRTSPDYTRRGGLYRVDWSDYHQTTSGSLNFKRLDAEVSQFVPLLRENWVIAMRALVSTTDAAADHNVPFFLMPSLGGTGALRGYPSWRFRDRNRLLLTGEYRWTAGPFVDMAVFVDAGKVAARAADLDLNDLKTSHGLGVSFHTARSTITRIELARSREGIGLSFAFSPSF